MKALIFGSLNIDHVYKVDHFVQPGETMESFDLKLYCGGKGLNQAIAFAKCGIAAYMAGAVGAADSEILLDSLEAAGVCTDPVQKKDGPSGHAIIQNTPDGENCILLFGGANQQITKDDADGILSGFDKGDFLILQNEINQMPYIMEQAHKKGMQIVLNPSPMNEKIEQLPLEDVNYLILNEIEGAALAAGIPQTSGKAENSGSSEISGKAENSGSSEISGNSEISGSQDASEEGDSILTALMQRFPETVIILTLGKNGSIYGCREERIHQSIFPVKAVDTTAAGDTFTGYFFGSLMMGKSPAEALRIASKASSIAVSRNGASSSIPLLAEVLAELD